MIRIPGNPESTNKLLQKEAEAIVRIVDQIFTWKAASPTAGESQF